jgi:hypothetical protein
MRYGSIGKITQMLGYIASAGTETGGVNLPPVAHQARREERERDGAESARQRWPEASCSVKKDSRAAHARTSSGAEEESHRDATSSGKAFRRLLRSCCSSASALAIAL